MRKLRRYDEMKAEIAAMPIRLSAIEPLKAQEGSIKTIPAGICRKGEQQ